MKKQRAMSPLFFLLALEVGRCLGFRGLERERETEIEKGSEVWGARG